MKKTLFSLLIFVCISISGQKRVSNILNSTNITEIESFLKEAHPSDTRQILLKSKLAKLKNVQLKTNEEKSNIDLKVPVNPTKYYTETTKAEVKEAVIPNLEKVTPVPVNPTKFYTEKVKPEGTETVKTPIKKLTLVPVNPTKFSTKETQPEETETVKTPVEKLALVPVNPTNYYTKTILTNNINPTVVILEKRQPIGDSLSNNTPLKTKFANNQPAPNTTKSEVVTVIVPTYYNANRTEEEEFQKLFSETTKSHKDKTVKLLNQLFDNDITNEHAILLVKNNGECNMIVRIQGNDYYNLAVPAHGENFVTVKKGNYQLSGNICEAKYSANKSIAKNMLVSLAKTPASFASPKIGLQSR